MSEENVLEHYRKMLEEVEEAIEVIQELMKSTNENTRSSAGRQLIELIDMKASIVNILASFELETDDPKKDKHPFSRRLRNL